MTKPQSNFTKPKFFNTYISTFSPYPYFFTLCCFLQSLSFYILLLNYLIPDLFKTGNLTLDCSLDVFSAWTILHKLQIKPITSLT